MKLYFWKMKLKQNQFKIRPLKLTEEHSKRIAWVIYFWKNRLWKKKFNFERTVFGKSTLSRFFLSHCLKFQKTLQIPTPRTRLLSDPPPIFYLSIRLHDYKKWKGGGAFFPPLNSFFPSSLIKKSRGFFYFDVVKYFTDSNKKCLSVKCWNVFFFIYCCIAK